MYLHCRVAHTSFSCCNSSVSRVVFLCFLHVNGRKNNGARLGDKNDSIVALSEDLSVDSTKIQIAFQTFLGAESLVQPYHRRV